MAGELRCKLEVKRVGGGVEVYVGHEVIRIEPWGRDSLRVRSARGAVEPDLPGALGDAPESGSASIETSDTAVSIANGSIKAIIAPDTNDWGSLLLLRFVRSDTGEELLAEQRAHFWWPGPRVFSALGGNRYRLEQHFRAYEGERLYGLGQRLHGHLDQKGMALDLIQRNAEVSIPFVLSNRGYGFLWNNPAVGHVELGVNRTRWAAGAARQIDYWITAGSPVDILRRYADVSGRAPELPSWATGFWQSKLRYRTQDELLEVGREYHRRGIPLSVIVVDFFHWSALGDWRFDTAEWPDPAAMIEELAAMGTRVMVSIWPLVSTYSENYAEMAERGLLVGSERGLSHLTEFPEKKGVGPSVPVSLYDSTNPEAREYIWSRCRANYLDKGVGVWWLDACEPELRPSEPSNLRFRLGPGDEVINLYPREHARGFYEGMRAAGKDEVVLLCRSAWAGSQRYGAAVWSGDIPATWQSLADQIRAGLNIAVSGIPWWTTDIGGFQGGDPADPSYRELLVRWFQYGAFCPLFRLHGDRLPRQPFTPAMTGGPNEIWSFGDESYELICAVISLRERIRPYIDAQMKVAHMDGIPPMRPLFVDFPDDPEAWAVEDEFMLGPDLLVAPITSLGARERDVHLPPGRWTDAWTGDVIEGGRTLSAVAPLERIPVFTREGARVPVAG